MIRPSGASTRADDPECTWLRFSNEDAETIQRQGFFDAATVAKNAIGLFVEEADRRGLRLQDGGEGTNPHIIASLTAAAVAEVVQGGEAGVPV